ncbi:uncharacterized protein LOC100181146 [Ciona intestinalis]
MPLPGQKQRKLFFTICVVCLLYSLHLTFRTVTRTERTCNGAYSLEAKWARDISAMEESVRTLQNSMGRSLKGERRSFKLDDEHVKPETVKTDYFSCNDFYKLPNTTKAIKENSKGNRGISFMKVRIDDVTIPVVFKEANRNLRTLADEYKYHTAKREVQYLTGLRGLPGIPRLFGSCVHEESVKYLVERIDGYTICNDNGTTLNCSEAKFILEKIGGSPDPILASLTLAYSTVRLFKLLEERHLLFEDVSGVNLMVTWDWELILVDADSLVFYNESRMFSKIYCEYNDQCPGPSGNLWIFNSLNSRIYETCRDLRGICLDNRCRGFDVGLHACGMAEWYLCKLSRFLEKDSHMRNSYNEICSCLRQPDPDSRCSFSHASNRLKKMLQAYISMH